jgi:ADP-ribose pyrophosphatase YjhB (NUDIX family)
MKFCSHCGKPVEHRIPDGDNRPRYICPSCRAVHYQNPRVVVGCIPIWERRILMCRRNIEPRKGYWTLPAGFLENGETTADGARRETHEETGAIVTDLSPYLMVDIVHVNQIYLMFRANLGNTDFHPTPESAEVKLVAEKDIPWNDIAFKAIEKTLRYYFKDESSGNFSFRTDTINDPRKGSKSAP